MRKSHFGKKKALEQEGFFHTENHADQVAASWPDHNSHGIVALRMDIITAKAAFDRFLGNHQALTFSVTRHPDGTWLAQCNEISGLMTAGDSADNSNIKSAIKDAILTAAGIDGKFADDVIRDSSISQQEQMVVRI